MFKLSKKTARSNLFINFLLPSHLTGSEMWVEANRFQQLRLLNAKIKKHRNAFSKTPLDRFIDKNHNSHVINGINSMCDIYGTVWRTFLTGFMTSEGTSELLNCCAMRLNRAYVIAHSHNGGGGGWRLECKRTAEQSNSLIKYLTTIISYVLFSASSSLRFFVSSHVAREHFMGNFVRFFPTVRRLKDYWIGHQPSQRRQCDVKICLRAARMLFQVL